MNRDDAELQADPFSDLLVAYDEALAAGRSEALQSATSLAPALGERLARAQACLCRLEQDRQRGTDSAVGPASGFAPIDGMSLDEHGGISQVGRWRIMRELGRGGNGIVYLAWDPLLQREVAVKVPRPEALLTPELRRRFLREARAAAGFHHPNLVPVFEAGHVGPLCYVVSAYCGGPTLGAWLKQQQGGVPPRLAAKLVADLAEAVAYIHQRGVLHRDIKPNNILLQTEFTAEDAEGRGGDGSLRSSVSSAVNSLTPKLTDFGLAKHTRDAGEETKSGTLLGTPLYMAPEQAEARLRDIGPHTDIYALGVILYELLTGRPPFQGDSDWSVRSQIAGAEPMPPRRLRPKIPRDLETVCLTCLQKDPRKRYTSAEALADDLWRYQEGRPVAARRVGQVERSWRWCRRRPAVAVLLSSLVCVFLAGFAGVVWQWRVAVAATEEKELQRQQAEAAREWSERLVYAGQIALAQREWQDNEVAHARELLDACRPELRGWEHVYLRRLFYSNQKTLAGHTDAVLSLAFSPDGKRLATGSWDRTVKVWDAESGELCHTLTGHSNHVQSVAFSPDGRRLASGSHDRILKIWDVQTGQEIFSLQGHTGPIHSVAFGPTGKHLVSGGMDGTVRIWDLETKQELRAFTVHTTEVWSVAYSPDGTRIASGLKGRTLKVWDAQTGRETWTLNEGGGTVAFNPRGNEIAGDQGDYTVKVWGLETRRARVILKGHPNNVTGVAFSPDGKRIVTSSYDRTVKLWDAQTGREMRTLKGHTDRVEAVTFSPDGKRIATASSDQTTKLWDPETDQECVTLKGHANNVWSVAFSSNGERLVSACEDGTVKVWDVHAGQPLFGFRGHNGTIRCMALSPDGRKIVTGSEDRTLMAWDAQTGQQLLTLKGHTHFVRGVAFSPDSQRIVSASHDGTLRIWDAEAGHQLLALEAHPGGVWSAVYSHDGKRIVSGGDDNLVNVWDSQSGQQLLTLKGHTNWVQSVAYSPDGKRILSGGRDRMMRVWDAETGQQLLTLNGHSDWVSSVAFSPDGKRIASSSEDRTVRIWDAETGQHLLTLKGHNEHVRCVRFSPDGKRLVSCGDDCTLKIWDTQISR